MNRINPEAIYRLLPAVHRLRDADRGEPLRALISVLAREGAVVEESIEQLLDNPDVDDELRDTFTYDSEGEHVAGGFSEDWNARLLEGGDLGDTDAYRDVVRESDDAAAVVYVNFDEGGWLDRVLEDDDVDQEVRDNVAPLEAVGMSVWSDDDVSHSVIRLTTE